MNDTRECRVFSVFLTSSEFDADGITEESWMTKYIDAVDCMRRDGKFDKAKTVLTKLRPVVEEKFPSTITRIDELQAQVDAGDTTSTDDESPESPQLPSLLIRGINFASAMARWTSSGFKTRTQSEIDERLAICKECPEFNGNACAKCGCLCNADGVINKLALKSESCPIGKWS